MLENMPQTDNRSETYQWRESADKNRALSFKEKSTGGVFDFKRVVWSSCTSTFWPFARPTGLVANSFKPCPHDVGAIIFRASTWKTSQNLNCISPGTHTRDFQIHSLWNSSRSFMTAEEDDNLKRKSTWKPLNQDKSTRPWREAEQNGKKTGVFTIFKPDPDVSSGATVDIWVTSRNLFRMWAACTEWFATPPSAAQLYESTPGISPEAGILFSWSVGLLKNQIRFQYNDRQISGYSVLEMKQEASTGRTGRHKPDCSWRHRGMADHVILDITKQTQHIYFYCQIRVSMPDKSIFHKPHKTLL